MKNPILADPFAALRTLDEQKGYRYYSLPALEKKVGKSSARLPVTIRIMLESLLRNCDGIRVKEEDVLHLMHWDSKHSFTTDNDIPFIVSRVLLQDFTGVPLLVDLAAMRDTVAEQGLQAEAIEPIVPVDLVVDHSVQVDKAGSDDAFLYNLKLEFERNKERYAFLNWGQQAFKTFKVIPPGIGIVHQVNLEHIASLVTAKESGSEQLLYFDTLVGTDSHTTMVNGLGVLGWGVGGIEAEAAMLGQPLFIPAPKVVGVHLYGRLKEAVTATDLTLQITELLRKEKVVGKFVEFFGEGAASLSVADRATISNMAPEYGATTGFFPIDEQTLLYLKMTGRDPSHVQRIKDYLSAQQLFGIPKQGQIDYSSVIELDLSSVVACVAGPKRPQDRLILPQVKKQFSHLLTTSIAEGGYGKNKEESEKKIKIHSNGDFHIKAAHITGGKAILESGTLGFSETEMVANRPLTHTLIDPDYKPLDLTMHHGSIVIAAITSCTNTSNPYVMIGAGLLAKKAVELGLKINPLVKTSLAPGSRVVTDYLEKTGLQKYLNALGFQMIAYGCTTCIGNSGPLDEKIEKAIKEEDMIVASVLSGNRNFEARIHGSVKANFLMSPPLVIAFALAGRIDIDLIAEPLAFTQEGRPVYLKEIWPSSEEIQRQIQEHIKPEMFINRYARILDENPLWQDIATRQGGQYAWDSASTYIQKPPFFDKFSIDKPQRPVLKAMRPLALFGDSITTDHISPAGAFKPDTPAGEYLTSLGVDPKDFNSYGSRRGNHHIMMRGTFANVRIHNKMAGGKEGGFTKLMPDGTLMSIFQAAENYAKRNVPLIIFAGKDYGMGSSRDWAAKGTFLLGVRVVLAQSFERIHRSNLVGMGVLPLQFQGTDSYESLNICGDETFSIIGLEEKIHPQQQVTLEIHRRSGSIDKATVLTRLDTAIDVTYYEHGGILAYVLRQLIRPLG